MKEVKMKKLLYVLIALALLVPVAAFASPGKVYVCKYVGTPGVDERLQTGNNPIEVSVSTLKGFAGTFPYEFADQQGKSIAIAYSGEGYPVKTIEDCPGYTPPATEATAKLTFICKAPETGWADAYVGSGVFEPVAVNAGDYIFRVMNTGQTGITSWEAKLAATLIKSGGSLVAGGHEFFTVQSAIAGLRLWTTPTNTWKGTSSTNETQICAMVPPPPPDEKDEDTCKPDRKMYMMATFEFPSGRTGTLVSWDGYPANKDRQLFWFCEVAENTPIFEWVYYNECDGKYYYNGEEYPYFNPAHLEPHWGPGSSPCGVGGCG
jgi:hypothetical protein